ncbi:MAG: hypothetical protein CMH28_05330 [Micavibrio sp.]|nr:hypothetical protein [Micavibrio sp.]|tara:strand:- start:748 stop:1056 length:309 start_codon:yes stop_codon:yes gene_type:complete
MEPVKSEEGKQTFMELWRGQKSLATTFWGYYVLVILLLRLFSALFAGLMAPIGGLLILIWTAFMIVPIWRAANNSDGPESFKILAKIFTGLLTIIVLLTLIF